MDNPIIDTYLMTSNELNEYVKELEAYIQYVEQEAFNRACEQEEAI